MSEKGLTIARFAIPIANMMTPIIRDAFRMALLERGMNLKDLAKALGCDHRHLRNVLAGGKSERLRRKIEQFLGTDLWGKQGKDEQ